MATFKQFVNLDDYSREILFWENGIFVETRREADYKYDLYQLFTFYVEMQYMLPSLQHIRFIAFENTDKLEPYLGKVDIACLL